jgi:hypothetical protein
LRTWKRWRKNRRRHKNASVYKNFRTASKSGKHV